MCSSDLVNDRVRTAANPAFNRPAVPGLLDAVQNLQTSSRNVNAVLVRVTEGWSAAQVAEPIRRWKHLTVFTREDMEDILVAAEAKGIAVAARTPSFVPALGKRYQAIA